MVFYNSKVDYTSKEYKDNMKKLSGKKEKISKEIGRVEHDPMNYIKPSEEELIERKAKMKSVSKRKTRPSSDGSMLV